MDCDEDGDKAIEIGGAEDEHALVTSASATRNGVAQQRRIRDMASPRAFSCGDGVLHIFCSSARAMLRRCVLTIIVKVLRKILTPEVQLRAEMDELARTTACKFRYRIPAARRSVRW